MELKTIGLTKKFGSKTAVDNLNITLTNGVYGLLGANGAGKTTLIFTRCSAISFCPEYFHETGGA